MTGSADRERFAISAVDRLVRPRSVAIMGVSGRPEARSRPGGRLLMHYLLAHGFEGPVYPVNPRLDEVDGIVVYPAVAAIPEPVDCVVIALPARSVPDAVDECGAAGIGQVLLLGAGFGELGEEGRALERMTLRAARVHGVRLAGPNSAGIVNVAGSVALSMTSVLGGGEPLNPGRAALVLQSGAMGSAILDRMRHRGGGISHMVSLGNQLDLDAADFLAHCAQDDATGAVGLYLEGIGDGPRFAEAVTMVEGIGKRVFVLLAGRSDLGERAAVTHTGRIIGRRGLEEALVSAAGATLVDDVDTLWMATHIVATGPAHHTGPRVGILTISGGLSVLASDELGREGGFAMPAPGRNTRQRLASLVPDYADLTNPLDLGSGTMPDAFLPSLLAFGGDPAFDVVAVVMPVVAPWWQEAIAHGIVRGMDELAKPVVVCWCAGETNRVALDMLAARGIPVTETPDALARLLAAYRGPMMSSPMSGLPKQVLTASQTESGRALLGMLAAAGVDVPAMEVVRTVDEALAAADRIGWPVAVKVEGVIHKTELGLVRAGLGDAGALSDAVDGVREAARRAGVDADEVLIEKMAPPGIELVLSIRRDPHLGEFAGVGFGGTLVELIRGVTYAPLPLTVDGARRLLGRVPGSELMFGYRGGISIDPMWVHRALQGMADVARSRNAASLEANPAIVGSDGGIVVDALLVPLLAQDTPEALSS